MERIAMNQEERDWLEWLKRVQDGVVTQQHAAAKMGVSGRWVRKLLARMKTDGDAVVVHGLRGRSSNRRIDEQTQARVVELLSPSEAVSGTAAPRIAPAAPGPAPPRNASTRRLTSMRSKRAAPSRMKEKDGANATSAASSPPGTPPAA